MNLNLTSQLDRRRRQLGMSKTAVARRSGVSLPTVNRILSGKENRPSLACLRAIAAVLGVEVRIGAESNVAEVVHPLTLKELRAQEKARALVAMVQATMALEGQAVDPEDVERMVRQTVHELMAGSSRRLWED